MASNIKKTNGVLTAIHDSVQFVKNSKTSDPHGRFHILVCDINQTRYTLVNVYGPNTKQLRFCKKLFVQIVTYKCGRLIIGGDFNIISNTDLDTSSNKRPTYQTLNSLLHSNYSNHSRLLLLLPLTPFLLQNPFLPHGKGDSLSLYSSPLARVLSDGTLSKPFDITNGTRQGCLLSFIIFALLIEPLDTKIRENPLISGIPFGDTDHKMCLFADYIILMVTNPTQSLPIIRSTLTQYAEVSYFKLNETKSLILNLHTPLQTQRTLTKSFPFKWTDHLIPYLRINLTPTTTQLFKYNYEPLLHKDLLHKDLLSYRSAGLSKLGRIAVLKMLILPKLLYLFRTLPIPLSSNSSNKYLGKEISQFYSHFAHKTLPIKTPSLSKWEITLEQTIPESTWQKAFI